MDQRFIYTTGKASEADIKQHLLQCNEAFTPHLSSRVDIAAYAHKIFANAITFEAWQYLQLGGLIAAYQNKENSFFFITNVSVLPELMGKGVAAALLLACVKKAKQNQIKLVTLEVNCKNEPAIKFYEKHGFKRQASKNDMLIMHYTL